MAQGTFERRELKYLISAKQKKNILDGMKPHMEPDEYGRSVICSLYYDTPDYLLIRRSLEKPVYKEKLRLRSYGVAKSHSTVYVELKKKYRSVVYKRRVAMQEQEAMEYLSSGKKSEDNQIMREIDYFMSYYHNPKPSVFLSYEREAFYGIEDFEFRVTFDENILWRDYDLSLSKGIYGNEIIQSDQSLMELKVMGAIPLWMVKLLTENEVYKTSFSKYGNAYRQIKERMENKHEGII